MMIRRKTLFQFVGFFLFSGVIILGWREYSLRRLPFDSMLIPPIMKEDKLEIPPRPGVQGIVITGPTIEPLFFAIDLNKSVGRTLDWQQLQAIDPHTDVRINGRVDDQGRLIFSQNDVLMEGHTEAGMMIQSALRTWVYTPYKSGVIRFWFNLPSKGRKLIMDTRDLKRREEIPLHIPIYDGKIHLVEEIPSHEILVGGYF